MGPRDAYVALSGGVGHATHLAGGPAVSGCIAWDHCRAPHLESDSGLASAPPLLGDWRWSHSGGNLGRGAQRLPVADAGGDGGLSGEAGGCCCIREPSPRIGTFYFVKRETAPGQCGNASEGYGYQRGRQQTKASWYVFEIVVLGEQSGYADPLHAGEA